jgi:hypothetical protein
MATPTNKARDEAATRGGVPTGVRIKTIPTRLIYPKNGSTGSMAQQGQNFRQVKSLSAEYIRPKSMIQSQLHATSPNPSGAGQHRVTFAV